MKRYGKKVLILLVCAVLTVVTVAGAFSVAAAYDGTDDPLISFSYLKENVLTKLDDLNNIIFNHTGAITSIREELASLRNALTGMQEVDNSKYDVVYAVRGQIVRATEAGDYMLRSGTAYALVPANAGGSISDYTTGTDILHGENIPLNHMLLIPRGDGRGLVVVSDEAYIMVRGGYTIEG